jgi:uncharacterized membrane protein YdjX (TVP38/TMEM64 family)
MKRALKQPVIRLWMIRLAIALGLLALVLVWVIAPLGHLLDQDALIGHLRMGGIAGIGLFLLAHVVATSLALPGTMLVIAGGAVYGVLWGTLWSVVGATLGAIAAFCLARYLLRGWFTTHLGHQPLLRRLNGALCQNSLNCVLLLRFTPISPFNVINFLLGLTPISIRPYAVGTLLGIMPGTAVYSWVGASGASALRGEGILPLFAAMVALALLSVVPVALRQYQQMRQRGCR